MWKSAFLVSEIDVIRTGLEHGRYSNEAAVCQGIVNTLLRRLGWPTSDTTLVCPEYAIARGRVDYALCNPGLNPVIFIEVKRPNKIADAEEQLFSYHARHSVPILILTDGRIWRFFYPFGTGSYNQRLICELNLSDTDSDQIAYQLQRYLSYDAIRNGVAIEAVAHDYKELVSQREASRRLPQTWQRLVDEADELLIKALADATEHDCGHTPSKEQILDFLNSLESAEEGFMEHQNDVPSPTPEPRPSPEPKSRPEKYNTYFQALLDEMREEHNFTNVRRPGKGNYYKFASGFKSIEYVAKFTNAGTVHTYLLIRFKDQTTTKNFFDALKERESKINTRFDMPLYWDRRDDINTSRIYIERDGTIESNESELEAFRAWHVENLLKFKTVFTPEIQLALEKLKSSETEY